MKETEPRDISRLDRGTPDSALDVPNSARSVPGSARGTPGSTLGTPDLSLSIPTSRIDETTDRLVTAIAIGEYLPGSRLPAERDLAVSLGVARMTVRAALARLADRGLIDTYRGRGGGSFVQTQWPASSTESVRRVLSARWDELRDTCDAIARLHGTVSRAAAERRTENDIALLHDRLDGYRSAASGLPSQRADELLHLAIIDAAANTTLRQTLHNLESRISISAPAHLWGEPEGMRAMELRALREHQELVAAIVDGRADDASAIARNHAAIDLELIVAAGRRAGFEA